MRMALLVLLVIAAAVLAACETQRLAQCDASRCPNGEAPRKEAPSPVNPPWWADPRDR
jgi:hypothetical protein